MTAEYTSLTKHIYWGCDISMEYEFDPDKDAANIAKYGISLGEAARFDWDMAETMEDTRYDYGEQCFKVTGLNTRALLSTACVRT